MDSSKRKNSGEASNSDSKKRKTIQFSETDFLKTKIIIGDKTA